jgi:predicted hotdog family 3-hydroxylacyl-ACP dehydratase
MIEQASLVIGNDNFAVKENSFLGYALNQNLYVPREMDVVRATTATRVNSAGLVEVVPYNLLTYSEQFDNAIWTKTGSTIIANTITAPNGTLTADKFIPSNALSENLLAQNIASISTPSFSIYAKKGEFNYIQLLNFGTSGYANFDLENGVIGSYSESISTIENVGNGWYRCNVNFTTGALTTVRIAIVTSATSTRLQRVVGDGTSGLFIWGGQLEQSATATDYYPTTTRLNIPRVDYSNGTPSILVEPQRTNLALRSEEFDNASWSKTRGTITANATTSPDGTTTADLWLQNSGETTAASLLQNVTPVLTTTYSLSVFAKKQNKNFLGIRSNAVSPTPSYFNLQNGTLGTINPLHTAKIEDYGNGWYRCSITYTATLLSAGNIFYPTDGSSLTVTDSGGVYLWGAQLEVGANVTSYIPTVAASVTRNADVISKTGISDLIGQTEGTIYAEINNTLRTYQEGYLIRIFADANNEIWIRKEGGSNTYSARFRANSVNVYTKLDINVLNGNNKIAFAYKSGNFAIYLNGTQVSTSTATGAFSTTVGNLSLGFSSTGDFNDRINLVTLWKERLDNATLATLTTL